MRTALLALTALFVPLLATDAPRPAPAFTFSIPEQGEKKLDAYKGKVVVLEFLLTTCEHCQRCSQVLNRLQRELGPKGMQPLGVAVNDNAENMVVDFVRQFNLDFPVGYSQRDPVIAFLQHPILKPMAFPMLVIMDRDGNIRHQFSGTDPFFDNEEKNLRELLAPLLQAKPGKSPKRRK